ncbi:hypothetical protein P5V15_009707 [Pogonomyrmex californicus]
MTDKQLLAYNRYQRFLQVLLTGCGCWHAPTKSGKSTYYWSVCLLPMLFVYATLSLRLSYMYRHYLAIMMKNIGVLISTFSTILKVSSFLINRRSLIDYHRTLTDLFEQELKQNEKIRMVMLSPLHGISTLAYIYFGIIITLLLTYLMPTLTVITHGILRFQLITNYTLPYSRGYGYLWTVPTGHLRHFHLFFEMAMITINCITCIGVDSVFVFYVYLLSSMMRAMTFRLTNPLPNDKFYDVLSTCVVKHQKLLRYCNALTHVYGPIILWHTVTNAILLCALIFETVQVCRCERRRSSQRDILYVNYSFCIREQKYIFFIFSKITIFLINRRYLIDYHGTMSDLFEEELKRDEKVRRVMLAPLRRISTLAYTHTSLSITLIMTYLVASFVVIVRGIFHLHLPTNYTLPYSRGYGYFWTVPNNFLRHFHLLFEWWALITQAITNASVDSAFGFYVYLLASTMRAMTFRLTNPLPNDKYSDVLRMCVTKHLKLIQCRDMLKRIYSVIILWHIVTNAILLCAVIYEALQLSDITIRMVFNIISYSVVKLLQTFIYAWYGTVITNADEDFRNGIYFSEWHNSNLDRHVRTSILLMMMQKPMAIKVFSISIDVVIFTNIAIFLINRRYLINYHGTMSDLFEEELKRDEKVRRVMLAPLRGISTLAYTHSSIMLILIMTYVMPPFVVIIRGIFHLYLPTDYTLPYSRGYGYFWTVPNNFLRHFHLLYEWWVIITQAVTNASVDSAFGFYVYLLASTMRAMTFRLTNPLPNDKYSDVLRVCVTKHLKLMQCRDMLKRIYSVIILWHIVTNAILLCAVIYEAMQLSDITIRIIFNITSYAVVKFLQTFTYAWYGTVITNAVSFNNLII